LRKEIVAGYRAATGVPQAVRPCDSWETRKKRGGVGTWSHPAFGRGSGFPLCAKTPWTKHLTARFPLYSQDGTTCGHAPDRFFHLREMAPSGLPCFLMTPSTGTCACADENTRFREAQPGAYPRRESNPSRPFPRPLAIFPVARRRRIPGPECGA